MRRVKSSKIREEILKIINTCEIIEQKGADPFRLDIARSLKALRKYLNYLSSFEDLCLDIRALNRLSRIVKRQEEWVSYKASQVFADPLLIELKLKKLSARKLADIFRKSWRPIIAINYLTRDVVERAVQYWNNLPPLKNRWKWLRPGSTTVNLAALESLIEKYFAKKMTFNDAISEMQKELVNASGGSWIAYDKFVRKGGFEETLLRAFLVSFLVTYNYADMRYDMKKNSWMLKPTEKAAQKGPKVSVAIAINRENTTGTKTHD